MEKDRQQGNQYYLYKKLDYDSLVDEKFEVKEYLRKLNLPDARLKFALRTKMTRTVQTNYKVDNK